MSPWGAGSLPAPRCVCSSQDARQHRPQPGHQVSRSSYDSREPSGLICSSTCIPHVRLQSFRGIAHCRWLSCRYTSERAGARRMRLTRMAPSDCSVGKYSSHLVLPRSKFSGANSSANLFSAPRGANPTAIRAGIWSPDVAGVGSAPAATAPYAWGGAHAWRGILACSRVCLRLVVARPPLCRGPQGLAVSIKGPGTGLRSGVPSKAE